MTLRLLALLLLGVVAAGCGKKAPPVPPETRVPRPVADLTGVVADGTIELAWTNPERRADGTRLTDLALARVFRADDAGVGEPPSALLVRRRVAGYTEVATIRLGGEAETAGAVVEGGRSRFSDRSGLRYGRRYTYVVVTEDARGRMSLPSLRLTVTFIAAPEPPPGLTAEGGERAVRLRWTPPPRLVDGSPVAAGMLAYEVLRAPGPEAPLEVVTPAPVTATEMVDRGLENDRTYAYAVRALRREGDTTARGRASARAEATPRDLTPPAPPRGLVAIPSVGAVHLSWAPSPDADVATYIIYRAAPGTEPVRVGSVRVPATTFVDREVAGGTYRYAVTAQDAGARPNESVRSNEVTVTVP